MKIDKLFAAGLLLVSCVAFTACSDDDEYTAGPQAGDTNVTFASYSDPVLAKTATSFDITLNRHTTSGTLTVPLTANIVPTGWTVPESASFAAGDSLATITVGLASDMEVNKSYDLVLTIPASYTNSYKSNNGEVATYKASVTKEDYETYATGTYDEEFFFGAQWPVTIEYSPSLDIYRIKSMFSIVEDVEGYHFYFKWNGKSDATQTFEMCNSLGEDASRVTSGFTYGSYGSVDYTWAAATNDPSLYDDDNSNAFGGYLASQNMFVLVFAHRVSAGTFGNGTDYIRDVKFVK